MYITLSWRSDLIIIIINNNVKFYGPKYNLRANFSPLFHLCERCDISTRWHLITTSTADLWGYIRWHRKALHIKLFSSSVRIRLAFRMLPNLKFFKQSSILWPTLYMQTELITFMLADNFSCFQVHKVSRPWLQILRTHKTNTLDSSLINNNIHIICVIRLLLIKYDTK